MTEITLETLHCTETEDITGRDDALLEVRIDGDRREPYLLRHPFDAGDDWAIDRTFSFDTSIRFTLKEGDWPDPDDTLGNVTLSNPPAGAGTAAFQEDDADYSLSYTVTTSAKHPAMVAVDDFKDSVNSNTEFYGTTRKGDKISKVWPRLSPTRVIEWTEHIARQPVGDNPPPAGRTVKGIDDVYEVHQDGIGYCGMAGIAFGVALRHPRRYVETVRSLLEHGEFLTGDDAESASGPLRRARIPAFHPEDKKKPVYIEEADWLIMASLRDSKNFFDSIEADDLEEGSTDSEQRYWIENVLGYSNASIHNAYSSGESAALQAAHDAHTNGGVGYLAIDHRMIEAGATGLSISSKSIDHFVTYIGGTRFSDGDTNVSFEVQSWGDRITVPPGGGTLSVAQFRKLMGAAVVGWPT